MAIDRDEDAIALAYVLTAGYRKYRFLDLRYGIMSFACTRSSCASLLSHSNLTVS